MALDEQLQAEAVRTGDEAATASIDARQWEILHTQFPDREDIAAQHRLWSSVAAATARRAGLVAERAGVAETVASSRCRENVAALLVTSAEEQELLEEKAANAEVWGLTDDEVAVARMVNPQAVVATPAQLRADAFVGRARVQALREWVERNPVDTLEAATPEPV